MKKNHKINERKNHDMKRIAKYLVTLLLLSAAVTLGISFDSNAAGWHNDGNGWQYIDVDGNPSKNRWLYDDCWFYLDENGEPDYIKGEASWVSTLLSISPTCISATATSTERVMSTLWVTSLVWMACPPTLVDFHSSGTVQLSDKFFET